MGSLVGKGKGLASASFVREERKLWLLGSSPPLLIAASVLDFVTILLFVSVQNSLKTKGRGFS